MSTVQQSVAAVPDTGARHWAARQAASMPHEEPQAPPASPAHLRLLAVGLNSVLQRTLTFDAMRLGKVNRARSMHETCGGKGVHFARAANTLVPGAATVAHFLGGGTGHFVQAQLETMGISQLTVRIEEPTRICTTLLDRQAGVMTELVEPSPEIRAYEYQKMEKLLLEAAGTADGIGLCGTFPPGVRPELYAELARNKGRAKVLLDGYRDVEATLATGQVDALKINADEVMALAGESDLFSAANVCLARYRPGCLAITNGPRQAFLFERGRYWVYHLAELPQVENPIGAGDTCAGVMLLRLLEGDRAVEAFAWGLAAASASCLHMEGAEFSPAEMQDLREGMEIEAR